MKALFNCRPAQVDTGPVPQSDPYLIPLCNKPLMEYWLDLCVWLGIHEIRVVDYGAEGFLKNFLGTGQDWGLTISFNQGEPGDVLPDMLARNRDFLDQDLILFDGLVFPFYDRRILKPFVPELQAQILGLENGQIRLEETVLLFSQATLDHVLAADDEQTRFAHWTGLPLDHCGTLNFDVLRPQSLSDYFHLNLRILEHHPQFHLRGFEVAPGVFEGLNNEIIERPALAGPLLTGQNCQLGADLNVRSVILHNTARLETPLSLQRCLVWGPVYLSGIDISDRLIYQEQVFNPEDGSSQPLEQPYLLKDRMEDSQARQRSLNQDAKLAQKLLWRRWPLYMLLRWQVPFQLGKFYLNTHGETLNLPVFERPETPSFLQRLFFEKGLHWVPFLLAVRQQRLLLVGTRLMPANAASLKLMQRLPIYAPGVFSHSMHLPTDSLEHWHNELHYASHLNREWQAEILQSVLGESA